MYAASEVNEPGSNGAQDDFAETVSKPDFVGEPCKSADSNEVRQ